MDDLDRYVEERSARDPEFAAGLESGYQEFRIGVLLPWACTAPIPAAKATATAARPARRRATTIAVFLIAPPLEKRSF